MLLSRIAPRLIHQRHVSVARSTMSLRSAVASKVASADAAITAAQPEPTQSSTEAGKEDIKGMQGAMLEPSAANKSWVRALAVAGATAAVAGTSTVVPQQGAAFIMLLSYALLLGTVFYTTFIVGLTLFKNLPRQTFGKVQSKLFPQYFAITTATSLVLLAGALMGSAPTAPSTLATLGTMAVGNLINALYLEPKCTKVMFARYDLENKGNKTPEDEAQIKALYKQFGALHGLSHGEFLAKACTAEIVPWTV